MTYHAHPEQDDQGPISEPPEPVIYCDLCGDDGWIQRTPDREERCPKCNPWGIEK